MPFDPNDPNSVIPPPPDTSQLPDQSAPSQFTMENANQAMTPQVAPPVVAQQGPLKGLLTNFFGGMGRAMMTHAGLDTPEEAQRKQQQQVMQQQLQQSTIQYHQALAKNLNDQNELVPVQQPPNADGTPQEPLYIARRSQAAVVNKQAQLQQVAQFQALNADLRARGIGGQIVNDPITGQPHFQPITNEKQLTLPQQATIQQKKEGKTPSEIRLRMLSDEGDPQATRILAQMQADKIALQKERGVGYALGRAEYTPFETVLPGTNIPTTISNLQALRSGAPKVSIASQQKLGGQYALFNDAYGILDKVDELADKVRLDDPGVSSKVAAGYAALKEPAAKGLTGELLSNIFARQPIYNTMTPDERDLVLTLAQGKAAGTGLRSILGQAGTNEMQQRLDSALFPGGQTAASTAGLKQQTAATRQLLDRFIVGQPQVGLNAPGTRTALQTKRGGGEPTRPPGIPPGYKFNAKGPKGAGWYKP